MSIRRRICVVTPLYPSDTAVAQGTFVQDFVRCISAAHEVRVIHLVAAPELRGISKTERARGGAMLPDVIVARYRPTPWRTVATFSAGHALRRALQRLRREGFEPDLLHAHTFIAAAAVAVGCPERDLPLITTEHLSAFHRGLVHGSLFLQAQLGYHRSDALVPVSASLQADIEHSDVATPGHVEVIPNAVDVERFADDSGLVPQFGGPNRLVTIGALLPHKGISELLTAFAKVSQKRTDVHLTIVGDGPLRQDCEDFVSMNNLQSVVTMLGEVSHEKLPKLLQQADLLISPSHYETFGMVHVEAVAAGTPVLATDSGGPSEWVNGSVGLLVPPKDATALANGIDTMLDRLGTFRPDLLQEIARQHFGMVRILQRYNAIYDTVV